VALLTVAAILVIVALMALMTRGMVAPADTGGVGAQDAKAGVVGSAIVHDDAGNVQPGLAPGYAPVHDDTGIMYASMVKDMGQMRGTDPGIMHASMVKDMGHDDAGNMPATGAGAAVIHDDAGNVR
jgi:hypothetical protein